MIPRSLALPSLLAASVAVPYVASNAPQWAESGAAKMAGKPSAAAPYRVGQANTPYPAPIRQELLMPPQGPGLYPTATPLEGVRTYALEEVLRLDVTKEWVYQRWSRKSTATADIDLFGVRVPLVSGTQIHDVAGSLTYYFDESGMAQKLTFHGRTGDTSHLVGLATSRFGLLRQSAEPGEQLFRQFRGADVTSELRTRPARVLWESSPHDSFSVHLTLQRPERARPLASGDAALQKIVRQEQEKLEAAQKQEQQRAAPADSSTAATTGSGAAKTSAANPDGWKAFFPRSRVPKPQIEGLDKSRNLW
jgi:hypothetical protein